MVEEVISVIRPFVQTQHHYTWVSFIDMANISSAISSHR